jgi:superfamily II DNA or RNA helicase
MSVRVPVTVTRSALTIKECPPELADALAFMRNSISFEGGDLNNTPERVSYAQYEAQTKLCRTYPNALHLVQAAAQKLGVVLEIRDQRLRPSLDLNGINRADYPMDVYQLLEAVAQSASSGVILVPTGEERTAIVCGLARMLPRHFKVLVTTDDQSAVSQIHESLAQALAGEKIGLHVERKSAQARIMVTHLDALKDFVQGDLAHSGYALREFDAWICDEAHRLPEPSRLPFLNQFRPAYAWALTATPLRADNSHQLLSVIFGPSLCKGNEETFDLQSANGQTQSVPTRAFVFPLPIHQPIAEGLALHDKVRIAYLKNPALGATLRGIDASLPETARIMVLVDSLRLGIILHKQLPHYVFLHSRQSPEHRQNAFGKLHAGEVHRVMLHVYAGPLDLPEVDYLIDCTLSGTRRASADGGQHASHLMLLCLGSERFFNDGLAKLQKMNALGWQVTYMFDRKLIEHLPFAQAPLLPELGAFPKG